MVSQTTRTHEPIIPTDADMRVLHDAACALASKEDNTLKLVLHDGTAVEVPASVMAAIRQTVEMMSENLAVAITPVDKRLTPRQAAQMLNVGADYIESVLTSGDMPFTTNGTIRLIALEDLLAYKRERDAIRREALREMTQLSQEMGFYQPVESDPGTS